MKSTTSVATAPIGISVPAWAKTLVATEDGWAPTLERVVLGAVLLPHGLQKTLGWFGGYGFEGTMGFFTGAMGLAWIVAFLVIAIESAGSLALLAGFAVRPVALGVVAVMVGAIATTHLEHGFFMNWYGNQAGEGFEYHLLVLALAASLLLRGGGRGSVDARVAERL